MLAIAEIKRLNDLLTHHKTLDLDTPTIARQAGVTITEAARYRAEFDRLMRWAGEQLRLAD